MILRAMSACTSLFLSLSVAGCALSESGGNASRAEGLLTSSITAEPFAISDELRDRIDEVQSECQCFVSVSSWSVVPVSPATDVFFSDGVLEAIVGQDIQLPWSAAGAINPLALANLLGPSNADLIDDITAVADPGGDFELGAHAWSHPTAPDFCSGETIYEMYFPDTGVLFAFRFDSSHEC